MTIFNLSATTSWYRTWFFLILTLALIGFLFDAVRINAPLFVNLLLFCILSFFFVLYIPIIRSTLGLEKLMLFLASLLFIAYVFMRTMTFSPPLLFFTFFSGFFFINSFLSVNVDLDKLKFLRVVFWVMLLLIFIIYLWGGAKFFGESGRFVGLNQSATTFSVWITAIFVLNFFLLNDRSVKSKILFAISFLAVTFLVYESGTRINFFFLFAVLCIYFFYNIFLISNFLRFSLLLLYATLVLSIYKFYEKFFAFLHVIPIVELRMDEAGRDPSFLTRLEFFETVYHRYIGSGLLGILFGNGAGDSRDAILIARGGDYRPHNDFIVLLNDFGAIFTLFFVLFVAYLGSRGVFSLVVCLLYFTSFLHNMAYTYYLISLLVLSFYLSGFTFFNHKHKISVS